MLEDLYRELSEKGVEILFTAMIGPVRDVLMRSGFMNQLGKAHQFMSISDAVSHINTKEIKTTQFQNHVMQYNERRFVFLKKIRIYFRKSK